MSWEISRYSCSITVTQYTTDGCSGCPMPAQMAFSCSCEQACSLAASTWFPRSADAITGWRSRCMAACCSRSCARNASPAAGAMRYHSRQTADVMRALPPGSRAGSVAARADSSSSTWNRNNRSRSHRPVRRQCPAMHERPSAGRLRPSAPTSQRPGAPPRPCSPSRIQELPPFAFSRGHALPNSAWSRQP